MASVSSNGSVSGEQRKRKKHKSRRNEAHSAEPTVSTARSRSRSPLDRPDPTVDTFTTPIAPQQMDVSENSHFAELEHKISTLSAKVQAQEAKNTTVDSNLRTLQTRVARNEVRIEKNEIIQRSQNFRVKFVRCSKTASRATLIGIMETILKQGLKYTDQEAAGFVRQISKIHPAGENRFIVKLNCSESKRVLFTRKKDLKNYKLGDAKSVSIEHDKTERQMRRQQQSITVCNRLRTTYPKDAVSYRIVHLRGEEFYAVSLEDNGVKTEYVLPADLHKIPFQDV